MFQALLIAVLALAAQDEEKHRTGSFAVRFTERHPLSGLNEVCRRMGWKPESVRKQDPGLDAWKIDGETFRVHVPDGYSSDAAYGLLVWISPGPSGEMPASWRPVLAEKRLIGAGADNSGNDRGVWYRVGFALDAVHSLRKRYTLDARRMYVAGFSGGGRSASRVAMAFPDVFTGGIYQGGVDFYRDTPDPANARRRFPATFAPPRGDLLRKVREQSRHVVLNGADDFNLASSKAIFENMRSREKLAHVHRLEMEGRGHEAADAAFLSRAIDLLDTPLKEAKPSK